MHFVFTKWLSIAFILASDVIKEGEESDVMLKCDYTYYARKTEDVDILWFEVDKIVNSEKSIKIHEKVTINFVQLAEWYILLLVIKTIMSVTQPQLIKFLWHIVVRSLLLQKWSWNTYFMATIAHISGQALHELKTDYSTCINIRCFILQLRGQPYTSGLELFGKGHEGIYLCAVHHAGVVVVQHAFIVEEPIPTKGSSDINLYNSFC